MSVINYISMQNNKKKNQVKNIILFLLSAVVAFTLLVTCATTFSSDSTFRSICGIVTLIAGAYTTYKATRVLFDKYVEDNKE